MASDPTPPPVIGATADDRNGRPVGTITTVFLDDVTGEPTWVGLTSGQHAAPQADEVPLIAPVTGSALTDGRLRLTVSADAVQSAPRISQPDRLTPAEETTLREHYRGGTSTTGTTTGLAQDATQGLSPNTVGRIDDTAMTRSEEQLRVSTVVEPWTRAVLRIEEFTEEVMVPVTVTRQRALIEHRPITTHTGAPADGGLTDGGLTDGDRSTSSTGWVTLYTEEPRVTVERVPAERVRLATSWVTEDTVVTDQVRREQVELTTSDTV